MEGYTEVMAAPLTALDNPAARLAWTRASFKALRPARSSAQVLRTLGPG